MKAICGFLLDKLSGWGCGWGVVVLGGVVVCLSWADSIVERPWVDGFDRVFGGCVIQLPRHIGGRGIFYRGWCGGLVLWEGGGCLPGLKVVGDGCVGALPSSSRVEGFCGSIGAATVLMPFGEGRKKKSARFMRFFRLGGRNDDCRYCPSD